MIRTEHVNDPRGSFLAAFAEYRAAFAEYRPRFGTSQTTGAVRSEYRPCYLGGAMLSAHGNIHSGMTRQQLLTVFTVEGGLSNGLHRTFVSRDCPYFKVDVTFRPEGRPERDSDGRVTLVEDSRDVIVSISRPYLQLSILD